MPRGEASQHGHTPTSVNHYTHWRRRGVPTVEWLGNGVGIIPVPWRGHPIRFTFSYVLENAGELALVDPGYDTDEGFEALKQGMAAGGFSLTDIDYVLVTHFHVDHWGMADRVLNQSGARLVLGEAEHQWYAHLPSDVHSTSQVGPFYEAWGVPTEELEKVVSTYDYHEPAERCQPEVLLRNGEIFYVGGRAVHVIHTPGHSPGHLVLADHETKRLFSGDHILPRITSNVSLNPFGASDPMAQFEESLLFFDSPEWEEWEVLPGHEYRFRGLPARVRNIISSIRERSNEIGAVIDGSAMDSVWDVARRLRWYRPWETFAPIALRMALGETAAHLVHLGYDVPREVGRA